MPGNHLPEYPVTYLPPDFFIPSTCRPRSKKGMWTCYCIRILKEGRIIVGLKTWIKCWDPMDITKSGTVAIVFTGSLTTTNILMTPGVVLGDITQMST